MSNKDKPINQKIRKEVGKKVWLVKTKEGKLIDSFRQLAVAKKEKTKLEKERSEGLILERDNSIRENLVKIER